jgi:hypothetical protein
LRTDMRGVSVDITSPSATKYAVESNVFYDNRPNGDLRIRGSIKDGDW